MTPTKHAVRVLLPLAAGLMAPAMPGLAAAPRPPEAAPAARGPDWLLLAVAGAALLIGRTVIPRLSRRGGKRPR